MSSTVTLTRSSSTHPNKSEVSASTKPRRRPLRQIGGKPAIIQSRGVSSSRASSSSRVSARDSDPQNPLLATPQTETGAHKIPSSDLLYCYGLPSPDTCTLPPKNPQKRSLDDKACSVHEASSLTKSRTRRHSRGRSLYSGVLPPPVAPPRKKLVILLRHAESHGNAGHAGIGKDGTRYLNPGLSRTGKVEASVLPYIYPGLRKLLREKGVILVSPLQRALQTMIMAFSSDLQSGLIAHEVIPALKTTKHPRDQQSWSPEGLQQDILPWNPWLNLSNIVPKEASLSIDRFQPQHATIVSKGTYRSGGGHTRSSASVSPSLKNTMQLKRILAARTEDVIMLVAHAGTFRLLTGQKEAKFVNAQPQIFSLSGVKADISLERLEAADECKLLGIPLASRQISQHATD